MYSVCQALGGTCVCTESISKDISSDHQIVLGWKESMITYCHFCLVFVFERHLCMSACACCRACNLEGVPAVFMFFALLSAVL